MSPTNMRIFFVAYFIFQGEQTVLLFFILLSLEDIRMRMAQR